MNTYTNIILPALSPTSWFFELTWSFIYPLIAIAAVYLAYLIVEDKVPVKIVSLFVINMMANVLYTPVLGSQNMLLASFVLLVILVTLSWFQMLVWKSSKALFVLMLPYWIWVVFATFLQLAIFFMNV